MDTTHKVRNRDGARLVCPPHVEPTTPVPVPNTKEPHSMKATPDTFYISHAVEDDGPDPKPWKLSVGGEIVREFHTYDGATVFVSRAIKSHIANYYDYATSVDEVMDMLRATPSGADVAFTVEKT